MGNLVCNHLLWQIEQALIIHLKKDDNIKKLVNGIYRVIPTSANLPIIKLGKTNFLFRETTDNKYCYLKLLIEVYTQEDTSEILLNICDLLLKSFSKEININKHKFTNTKISEIDIEEGQDGRSFKGNLFLSSILEMDCNYLIN